MFLCWVLVLSYGSRCPYILAIILPRRKELVALLHDVVAVCVPRFFLVVQSVGLQYVRDYDIY